MLTLCQRGPSPPDDQDDPPSPSAGTYPLRIYSAYANNTLRPRRQEAQEGTSQEVKAT